VPPPSTDEAAWWEDQAHPLGVVLLSDFPDLVNGSDKLSQQRKTKANPFESDSEDESSALSASPTSSDEELYTHALSLQTPITPTPHNINGLAQQQQQQQGQSQGRRAPPPPPLKKIGAAHDGESKDGSA
jgi:hypothetical protein